jgi:peptide/nickel transport system substrate-binding protein
MLYEVGPDALDSLESSTSVGIFTFTRRYQYLIALNSQATVFRSPAVRRALNMAIDRPTVVRVALNQHGLASSGPIWPRYWALQSALPTFQFDPARAADLLSTKREKSGEHLAGLRFTCLVQSDSLYERIALEVKRQLQVVGVDMDVRAVSQDELFEAENARKYDAILTEGVSGPTLLRLYFLWHSGGAGNPGGFGNATLDAAFDRARRAASDAEFRQSVSGVHQAFMDDPPAIFLAWNERARAVSKRFTVPAAELGRDILSTLRLWRPSVEEKRANRN